MLLPILREAPGPTCPHRGGQRAGGGLVSRKVINFGSANFMTEFNTVLGRGVGGARDSEDSDPPPRPRPRPQPQFPLPSPGNSDDPSDNTVWGFQPQSAA